MAAPYCWVLCAGEAPAGSARTEEAPICTPGGRLELSSISDLGLAVRLPTGANELREQVKGRVVIFELGE